MNHGDADGFELRDVENFVVVEIVDVTVGDEIKSEPRMAPVVGRLVN